MKNTFIQKLQNENKLILADVSMTETIKTHELKIKELNSYIAELKKSIKKTHQRTPSQINRKKHIRLITLNIQDVLDPIR